MRKKFKRWTFLFVQYLKRDWFKIMLWVLGLGLFAAGFIPSFQEIAKGQGLPQMFEALQNPAMIAIIGSTPIETASDYTLGALYTQEMLLFSNLFAMVIAVIHVVSHTRREEDLGIAELMRSLSIGRQAHSLATIAETVFVQFFLAVVIAVAITSFADQTLSTKGSLLFGLSVGIAGVIGASLALVFAQIMPTSSAATGSTLAIIGLLYLGRAVTDIFNADLSMFNPLGWTYLTYPYTENNWLPLLFALLFSIIMLIIAFILEDYRDLGAGYLPQREGRERATKSLLSVHGLLFRLNRSIVIRWLIAFVIIGAAYGSLYGDMQTFIESNDLMKQIFSHSNGSIEEIFTGTIMTVMISLVSILPIATINKLFSEERHARFSQHYVTKVTRSQLYWTSIGVALCTSIVGTLFAAGSLGVTALLTMENSTINIVDFLAAGYHLLPSILFYIGLATVALGFAPRMSKVVYVYLGYSFILDYFRNVLDLPDWLVTTAIQSWIPKMPTESFDALTFVVITTMSTALMVIGYIGYKNRDMIEGA